MNYWIWFSQIKKLGPIKKLLLLNKFLSPEEIYKATKEELLKVDGISEEIAKCIFESKNEELIHKYDAYIKKNDIKVINFFDDEYPEKLRHIYAPPITLFAKGNLDLLHRKSLAIVGTRMPSKYGEQVAEDFAKELSKNNITIISGMARGIDSIAHMRSS